MLILPPLPHETCENQHCACAGANRVNNDHYLLIFSLGSIQILILEGKMSVVLENFNF